MAFQYDDLVGTGETYTTPQSWETARNISELWTGDRRMRAKAEQFGFSTSIIDISGGGDTGGVYYLYVEADSGAEHDGRFNANSGIGNARFIISSSSSATNGPIKMSNRQDRIKISWLELSNSDEGAAINMDEGSANVEIHHCLARTVTTNPQLTLRVAFDNTTGFLYRNVILQETSSKSGGSDAVVLHNTYCGASGRTGITSGSTVQRNVSFNWGTCFSSGANSGENAASDLTGDTGLDNLTPTDNIVDDTADWASFDPTIKTTGTIYQASSTTYNTSTYPEIDVPITDREATITGTWSLGADDAATVLANIIMCNIIWWDLT